MNSTGMIGLQRSLDQLRLTKKSHPKVAFKKALAGFPLMHSLFPVNGCGNIHVTATEWIVVYFFIYF